MGKRTRGMKLQVLLLPPKRPSSSRLPDPTLAVRLMVGNMAARAAPMLASMARRLFSAAWISGRTSSTLEGSGAGTGCSAAAGWAPARSVAAPGSRLSGSGPPTSNCRALRSRSTWEVKLATSPRAVSTVVWFWASTRPEVEPISCMRRVSS
ncbi:MAG: hypothetical protein GAK34_03011 [Delftia tsuruhatensis]|nr:MAG: hypothetical protein GAK34_03011 [Delftia tsuruhatensis]